MNISETLVTHTRAEKAATNFSMFQMAKLEGSMSISGKWPLNGDMETDMRSRTNSEPEPRPRTPKIYGHECQKNALFHQRSRE